MSKTKTPTARAARQGLEMTIKRCATIVVSVAVALSLGAAAYAAKPTNARVRGVVTRPEQLGQHVTRPRPLDQRQVGEQRHRLAGVEGDRDAVVLDPRGAEQHHLDRSHLRTP